MKPGEKVEKPSPLKGEVAQDKARLRQEQAQPSKDDATLLHQKNDKRQQELAEDSESSSTGGNTQNPSSSSKNYVLMELDTSNNPVMTKCSSQGSTDKEKTMEEMIEVEGDRDGQQDGASAHSQGSGSQKQIVADEEEKVGQWFMCSCHNVQCHLLITF